MFVKGKSLLAGLCWLSLSVALISTRAHAGLLYSNGGLNPQLYTKSGASAPPGSMWSELQNNAGDLSCFNNIYGVTASQGFSRLADDFTIPAGKIWTLGFLDFYGLGGAAPDYPYVSMNVQIWNGRPGDSGSTVIAGDLTTNVLTSSTDTQTFRQDNTLNPAMPPLLLIRRIWKNRVTFSPGIKLSEGTYWIAWQSVVNSPFANNNYVPTTLEGVRGLPAWNARRLDVVNATWIDVIDPGKPAPGADVPVDFAFDIYAEPVCGDTVAEGSEQCDDGNRTNGDGCDNNCTKTACGNGVLTNGEVCDDGNTVSGDGCDNNCTKTACGNGVRTAGEVCDDGNTVNGDGCDNNCKRTACGNGVVTMGEACDDGNMTNGDGCDSNCTVTACGNGVLSAGEVCDDGNTGNGDGCDNNCTKTACGNGIQDGSEQCDDGNILGGDGCSVDCALELRPGGDASAGGCAGGCKISGGPTDLSPLFFWIVFAAMAPFSLRRKRQTV